MISARQVANALNINIIESPYMSVKIQGWLDMYTGNSDWNDKRIESIGLPAAISAEISRLTMCEADIKINNSYCHEQFKKLIATIGDTVEIAAALGGVLLKPYALGDEILTETVYPMSFFPVSYNHNGFTSVICPQQINRGRDCFTRLEYHEYDTKNQKYLIKNQCYRSQSIDDLGTRCRLTDVPDWAELKEEKILENVEKPLFAYLKMPFLNNVDLNSPLGVSVYSKSVNLIKQADEQWERILWEYESSERAIDASEDLFIKENDIIKFPKGRERLFRLYEPRIDGSAMIDMFSPAIRDTSMFNGLNKILQRIEFNCGLAYGTISDVSNVEKTAEEIKTSKQRSYTQVASIQKNLKTTLEHLAYIYSYYGRYYGLMTGDAEMTCTFGDSVLEDSEKEFQRRLQMVSAGLLSKEKFVSWYFGCSEEEAKTYIPETTELFGGV